MGRHILIVWEMGSNLGHLSRDVGVARKLRELGHKITFVVRDANIAEQVLTPEGFTHLPAPKPALVKRLAKPIESYAEILIEYGYADELTLPGLVREWLQLFTLCEAQLIIIDHAPTALLAARIAQIAAVVIGSGFEIPPNVTPLPGIRPGVNSPSSQLQLSEMTVVQAINTVFDSHAQAPIHHLAELFTNVTALLTTFPELDHYGPRNDREYVGPIHSPLPASSVTWSEQTGNRILVYLRTDFIKPDALLSALSKLSAEVICVIPKADEAVCKRYTNSRLRIFNQSISIEPLMRDASLVVNYGGAGTITQTLLQGVPMLLLPPLLEQHVGALKVANIGAAIVLNHHASANQLANALNTLLNNPAYKSAAQRFAQQHQSFDSESALQRIVHAVTTTLQQHIHY